MLFTGSRERDGLMQQGWARKPAVMKEDAGGFLLKLACNAQVVTRTFAI